MNIKLIIIIALAYLTSAPLHAADENKKIAFPGGKCWLYRVALSDKKGTPYTIEHPEKYLSQKAIQRRNRQQLAIDSTDLPLSPQYLLAIKEKGFQIVGHSKWNNTVVVRVNDTTTIKKLHNLPFVKHTHRIFVSPDSVILSKREKIETDITPINQNTPYGDAFKQINTINGIKLHEAGFRGAGMTIAIIDGGFMNVDKIPLLKNVKVLGAKNFTYPQTSSVYQELDHGTAVLSCISAQQSGRIIGTAPEASFWLLRSEYGPTESEAEEDWWTAAAEFADSVGVDLINSSLGYHNYDDNQTSHTYQQLDGKTAFISITASRLVSKGIILTNSAGNDGENQWHKISVPADAPNILTVGALRRDCTNATFSSLGYSADGRVKPDVMAIGNPCALIKGNGIITEGSGTSFSAPVTCGMVACLWQALPQLNAQQIMQLVRESADRYKNPDNVYGYGIPDFWYAYQQGLKTIQK